MAEPFPPMPDTLTVTPDPASMPNDGTLQFTATAYWGDPYFYSANVTGDCLWMCLDPGTMLGPDESIAWIGSITGPSGYVVGLATAVAPGTCPVRAQLDAVYNPGPPGAPTEIPSVPSMVDTAELTVTSSSTPPPPPPEGRFHLAFDDPALEADPAWTRLDAYPNLVTSYTIDRGRSYELDRTDTGRAVVQVADPDGVLDPTNPDGPYYSKIEPLVQAAICRYDPVAEEWNWRYRGFVEDYDYVVDPSQRLNHLVISLVDLFEILTAAEMQPGKFGEVPPSGSEGQVYFPDGDHVETRIKKILDVCGIRKRQRVLLTGNVTLKAAVYSPGESPLAAIQEAVDGEMPAVANLYCDRQGRIVFHGRLAKFFPESVAAEWGAEAWDYHDWKVGDGAAIEASPLDTVQLRELGFNRGLGKLINSASALPLDIEDSQVAGQLVFDGTSIGKYGVRSWSASSLLTKQSLLDDSSDLVETKRFATYYCANYAAPRDRVTACSFRSLAPDDPRAPALWQFLSLVDIADSIEFSAATSAGEIDEQFFVEGIHEEVRPLDPDWDDVTLRLDLSPRAYFATNPWPDA